MALDVTIFKTVAPEFDLISSTTRDQAAILAELQVTVGKWRLKAPYAVALMTAHILKMSEPSRSGKSGSITSETVSSLSRSYGAPQKMEGSLDETSYGREFKRLRRQIVTSPLVV